MTIDQAPVGNAWSSQNNQSPLMRFGVSMDPLAQLFPGLGRWHVKTGDKLQKWVSNNIADEDPLIQHDRHDGLASWSKEARKVSDWAVAKPLDTTALVLGGVLGGGALAGGLGGGGAGGGAAGAGLGTGGAASTASFMPGSAAAGAAGLEGVTVVGSAGGGAAMTPGTAAALGAAAASANGATPQSQNQRFDWQKMMENMPQQSGGQQEQQAAPRGLGQQQPARAGNIWQRMQAGLGRIGENLFPIDQAYGMSPAQQQAMRRQAGIQMGLGMIAAANSGAGFGEAASFGLGKAQQNLNGALQRGYENARAERQEKRQLERDKIADERYIENRNYQIEQDRIANDLAQRKYQESLRQFDVDTGLRGVGLNIQREGLDVQREGLNVRRQIAGAGRGYRIMSDEEKAAEGFAPDSVVQIDQHGNRKVLQAGISDLRKYNEESAALENASRAFSDLDSALSKVGKLGSLTGAGSGRLGTAYGNARSAIRVLYNTGVLQPGELPMLEQALQDPNSASAFFSPRSRDQVTAQIKELQKSLQGQKATLDRRFSRDPSPTVPATQPTKLNGRNYVQIDGQWYEEE